MVEFAFSGINIRWDESDKAKAISLNQKNIADILESQEFYKEVKRRLPEMYSFYKNNSIDKKYLWYAKDFIEQNTENKNEVKENVYREMIQIIEGKRFVIQANKLEAKTKKNRYIQFEIEKNTRKGIIIQGKEITWECVMRRHIDKGADISKMTDCILEWAKLIRSIPEYKDIKFLVSCSRLNDKDFIDYRKSIREEHSNIIAMAEEENKHGIYIDDGWRPRQWFWHKRVQEGSNLWNIITKYEVEKQPLKNRTRIIDLDELENRIKTE